MNIQKLKNHDVIVKDALGIIHNGRVLGQSSTNKENVLIKISKNKIMEISHTRIIKVL